MLRGSKHSKSEVVVPKEEEEEEEGGGGGEECTKCNLQIKACVSML
jgi:hypothetical protein